MTVFCFPFKHSPAGQVRCPECRQEHFIPQNGFPTNVSVQRMLNDTAPPNVPINQTRAYPAPSAPPMPSGPLPPLQPPPPVQQQQKQQQQQQQQHVMQPNFQPAYYPPYQQQGMQQGHQPRIIPRFALLLYSLTNV